MNRDDLPQAVRSELEQLERDPRVDEPIDILAIGRARHGVAFHARLHAGPRDTEDVTDSGDSPERAWRNFTATVADRLAS